MAQATVSTINFRLNQEMTSMNGSQYQTRIFGAINPENNFTTLSYLGFCDFVNLQVPCWAPEDYLYHDVVVEVTRKCGTKLRVNDTKFYITSQGKTLTKKFFVPDLVLAQELLKALEEVNHLFPGYVSGFSRKRRFTTVTITEIVAWYWLKAEAFAKAKVCKAYQIPSRYWGFVNNVEGRNKALGMWRTAENVAKGHDDRPFGGHPRAIRTILVDGKTIDWDRLFKSGWGHALWGFRSPILSIWASKTGWLYTHLKDGSNHVLSVSWEDPTETMDFLESCIL